MKAIKGILCYIISLIVFVVGMFLGVLVTGIVAKIPLLRIILSTTILTVGFEGVMYAIVFIIAITLTAKVIEKFDMEYTAVPACVGVTIIIINVLSLVVNLKSNASIVANIVGIIAGVAVIKSN